MDGATRAGSCIGGLAGTEREDYSGVVIRAGMMVRMFREEFFIFSLDFSLSKEKLTAASPRARLSRVCVVLPKWRSLGESQSFSCKTALIAREKQGGLCREG